MTERVIELTYFPEKFDPSYLLYRSDSKEFYTVGGTFDSPVFNKIGAGADPHEFSNIENWVALSGLTVDKIVTINLDNTGLVLSRYMIKVDDVIKRVVAEETSSTFIVKASSKLEIVHSAGLNIDGITNNQEGTISGPAQIRGMYMSLDGVNLVVVGSGTVQNFILSTPYDITTVGASQGSVDISTKATNARTVTMKPDGTEMYVGGIASTSIHQYTLSTPWDMDSATFTRSQVFTTSAGVRFSSDGLNIYHLDLNDNVKQYKLTTAWDISTIGAVVFTLALTSTDNIMQGLEFSEDGFSMLIIGNQNDKVYEYRMTSQWTLSTAIFKQDSSLTGVVSPESICVGNAVSRKIYVNNGSGLVIDEFDLANNALGQSFASII